MFEENLIEETITVRFQKKTKKKREFSYLFFESISFNNVLVTKQVYFSSSFFKSWFHISDNIAGVVEGPKYY